jgi:hypothetical protein
MQRHPRTIITSLLGICFSAALFSVALWAHGGFDHVMGTVSKLDANVLTVKTTKGDVNVKLNAKTEIMMGDHKAAAADLKVGVRVVVDIPEGSKDNMAHSVKIGADAHDAHK